MATSNQLTLIDDLLEELGWDHTDLVDSLPFDLLPEEEDPSRWTTTETSGVIEWLIETKRELVGSRRARRAAPSD